MSKENLKGYPRGSVQRGHDMPELTEQDLPDPPVVASDTVALGGMGVQPSAKNGIELEQRWRDRSGCQRGMLEQRLLASMKECAAAFTRMQASHRTVPGQLAAELGSLPGRPPH